MSKHGVVAAGHPATAESAAEILREGGNAYDAVIAAVFSACIAEPVLASLAGGGFLMAHPQQGQPQLYDFFVQTPRNKCPKEQLDFYPIAADFGTTTQEFHIGLGSVATPGVVKGLFHIHQRYGSMPMSRLVEPAIALAKEGLPLNPFQAYILDIISPIMLANPHSRQLFANTQTGQVKRQGECFCNPDFSNTLEALAKEGDELFYQGEIAQRMVTMCEQRGHLRKDDLQHYQVESRNPLKLSYHDATLYTNPPPSSGGILMAFTLALLEPLQLSQYSFGSFEHLAKLSHALALTNQARVAHHANGNLYDGEGLNPHLLAQYHQQVLNHAKAQRGTTHISIIDRHDNCASLTLSNGEGCGSLIPGTGIMLNNMLGEEDLNPCGFHQWQSNQRMTSMMAPSILESPRLGRVVMGSGGSNRIRSALLQLTSNLVDFELPLQQAVEAPRLHMEGEHLSIEGGFNHNACQALHQYYPDHQQWQERNLFFGGTHVVSHQANHFYGAGDPRRGGATILV